MGSLDPDEDRSALRAAGTAMLQISGNRLADVLGQWKAFD